jgi:hypothetical protein
MSQANQPPTTSLISFSSAGVRRARHAAALPAVQLAHRALIAALGAETPHHIVHNADRFDIMERRDHLKTVITPRTHSVLAAYGCPCFDRD